MMATLAELRARIEILDEVRCAYCGTPQDLAISTFELDHILPRSAGGPTEETNVCLACPACNRYKAARQYGLDPETEEIVPLFHPRNQRWSEHFLWTQETLEVVGLTPTGRATAQILHMNRPQLLRLRRLWARLHISPWAGLINLEESA
jgi:5-methylcytosine-specific restriction endonuclease McrA